MSSSDESVRQSAKSVRRSKGDQARTEILDAAHRLFLHKGYTATSMRDIAEASGNRAVAGIYNHFATKQTIFEALIQERNPYEQILDIIEGETATTAPEYISNVLHRILPLMNKYEDFIELAQLDQREFQGAYLTNLLQKAILPHGLQLVSRLQTLPGLKSIEPLVLIRLLASTGIAFVLTQRLMPGAMLAELTPEAWIDLYIDSLLYGICDDEKVNDHDDD